MTPSKCILFVEDDHEVQESIGMFLKLEGFNVYSAYNGQEGLDYLKNNPAPDLILLDLMMPVLNGYEFVLAIEKMKIDIPVIVCSAASGAKQFALQNNLAFLAKPFGLEDLSAAVNRI
jgi:two-component system chemotaxis response regulator CheY